VPGKSGEREPTFLFLGGASCLDLTATMRAPRGRVAERLRAPQDLVNWLVAAGLADQPPSASSQDLVQARTLREAIYETIRRRMAGRPPGPGHLAIINNWAGRPPPRAWLQTEDGRLRARHDAPTAGGLAAAAVLQMGEGAEQTPIAILTELPVVHFQDATRLPKSWPASSSPFRGPLRPFLTSVQWRTGARRRQIGN
jgi:Putative stress-induced transcription regulator